MKSFYIIIRGPLGIGKTTIAKKLAEKLQAEIFHIDDILKELNLDKVDEKIGSISAENFLKANTTTIPKAKNYLEKGIPVILDGCFYFKEQIEDIVGKLDYPVYIFTLKASVGSCIERDSKREKVYGKEAAEAVHKRVSGFDMGTIIDTESKTEEEVAKEILKKIK